jgi:hypothetical protein
VPQRARRHGQSCPCPNRLPLALGIYRWFTSKKIVGQTGIVEASVPRLTFKTYAVRSRSVAVLLRRRSNAGQDGERGAALET